MNEVIELFVTIAVLLVLFFLYRNSTKKRKNWSTKKKNRSTLITIGFVLLISIIVAILMHYAHLSIGGKID